MIAKFSEVERAVAYLWAGLGEHLREQQVGLAFYPDGVTRSRTLWPAPARVKPTLELLCRRFPNAIAAVVHIEGHDLPAGAIQCRCPHDTQKICTKHCLHHRDRPIASVLVCPYGIVPSNEDWQRALCAFHDCIHTHQLDENTKRDRQRHHHSHGLTGKVRP